MSRARPVRADHRGDAPASGGTAWQPTALLDRHKLEGEAVPAAIALLGMIVVREHADGSVVAARIVETEAYDQHDPASHSARGRTRSNASMFARAGTAYVYRSYGVHWCLNIAVGAVGEGAAVLLRGAEVLDGHAHVRARRPRARGDASLLRGPGCLAAGLDIDATHDGLDLCGAGSVRLHEGAPIDRDQVQVGPRVGVRANADMIARFHLGVAAVSSYRRHPQAPAAGAEPVDWTPSGPAGTVPPRPARPRPEGREEHPEGRTRAG